MMEIKKIEGKGRCFVSNSDLAQGQLIHTAKPYVYIVDTKSQDKVCAYTFKEAINMVGCECGQVYYIGEEERKLDKIIHDKECGFLKEIFGPSGKAFQFDDYRKDYLRLLIRCLTRRWTETVSNNSFKESLKFSDVWAFCDNKKQFPPEKIDEFSSVAKILLDFAIKCLPQDNFYTLENMLLLVCKEECNSFGVYDFKDKKKECYGLALYPSAVYFNHSCCPNVVHTTLGRDQVFYASRPIKAGEELSIAYIDIRQTYKQRQDELEKVFLFSCDCQRCLLEESSGDEKSTDLEKQVEQFLCQEKECNGVYLPINKKNSKEEWICEACESPRA